MKRSYLKPKPMSKRPTRLKVKRKPKKTKIALFREYGVPDRAYRRYSGIKGVYWYYFSRMIRERDYKLYNGLCMTCLKYVERGSDQCGHLFPARDCGFTLLFHPLNNHLQHSKCNNPRFTPSAGIHNAINIEKRYGTGTIEKLAQLKLIKGKEWTKETYRLMLDEIMPKS